MSDVAVKSVSLEWLLTNYRPGSQGDDWTWDDEEQHLLAFPCLCASEPPEVFRECDTPGHYQLMLEEHMRTIGRIEYPVLLGNDGRVWDGHHRIVASRRLGLADVPIEGDE